MQQDANNREITNRKYPASGEVACGLEPSLVKDYRGYWLISGRDALNCSAVCVSQGNRIHTEYLHPQPSSHNCVHFGLNNSRYSMKNFREFSLINSQIRGPTSFFK